MNTCFMEKSYVIAAIFWVKDRTLRERHVTLEECNMISRMLQKEYNNNNLNVCITDSIDSDYFKVADGIVTLKKENDVDLQTIVQRYQGYMSNIDILLTLWDEEFILKELRKLRAS